MIQSTNGFALGTYTGATLNKILSGENGYWVLALSRKIPNGTSDIGLTTPTGFTKLSESISTLNGASTAEGLYIKKFIEEESISISLPPDPRITVEPVMVPTSYGAQLDYLQNYRTVYNGQIYSYITLPYNANAVYGVEIEYKPDNWLDGGGNWPSIFSGWIDDFTIGNASQYRGLYLRYRGAEIYYNAGNVLTSGWNTISVRDNKFTVNGSVLGTVNSSLPLGQYSAALTMFNMVDTNGADFNHSTNGQIRKIKIYGAGGVLLSTWYPFQTEDLYGLYSPEYGGYCLTTDVRESDTTEGGITPGPQVNYGISGDILGVFVEGADSYAYDASTNNQKTYEKNGTYSAVYIGSSINTPISKDGTQSAYSSRYIAATDYYDIGGRCGLIGGFSPSKSSGITFNCYNDITSYEVKFIDSDTVINKPKLGAIVRNGIHYGPEASKVIPTYNGTFINDFRVEGVYNESTKNIIKYTIPSGVSNYYSGATSTALELNNTDIVFGTNWNIGRTDPVYSVLDSYQNILLGGKIVPYRYFNRCYKPVMEWNQGDHVYATNNVILGGNNILTSINYDYFYNNVIIGNGNVSHAQSSSWRNWIIGDDNDINNNGYGNVFCGGMGNHYDIGYRYGYGGNAVIGGSNTITNPGNYGSVQLFIGGVANKIECCQNSQSVLGLSNIITDINTVSINYYYNNTYRTETDKDVYGRYGLFVTGSSNEVYGGANLCAGYHNIINNDIGFNSSQNFSKLLYNTTFSSRCVIGNSNTIAGTLLTIGYLNQVTNGALSIIGELNRCNLSSNVAYCYSSLPWTGSDNYYLFRKSLIFGSGNQSENSGSILGFLNNATSTNIIVGDSNTTSYANTVIGKSNTVTNSSSSQGNIFGDSNNVSGNSGDVFGSSNTVSSGGCHVYGNGNTVNGGSYCVGFGNTAINGSTVFGSSNNVTGGGSWKVIGFNNALQGGGGPVIGNGNTFNSGNMTYGVLGFNNTVESGGAAFGCGNNSIGGSIVIGHGNTANSGSTIIGTSNRITGGGGHYIVGIGNEANTTSAQIVGFSNIISAGLAIGKYLSNTDTNGSRITIGAYNNASVDIGTRVVFGDGTGTSDRHNLFISDYNHNTYFSGNIYGTNLPDAPNTAGTYTLQCVVTVDPDTSEVSKSYSWV